MIDPSANPFAALLEESETTASASTTETNVKSNGFNSLVEDIFGFTLNETRKDLVYLKDVSESFSKTEFDLEILEHALFERLLLENASDYVPSKDTTQVDSEICDKNVIRYLFSCFKKTESCSAKEDVKDKIKDIILRNVVTALKQPELYEGQDLIDQVYTSLKDQEAYFEDFFLQMYKKFVEDEDTTEGLREPFTALLKRVHIEIAKSNPVTLLPAMCIILNIYTSIETLALFFLDYCKPKDPEVGIEYANTLLGALFSVSILPKTVNGAYEFFRNPLDQASIMGTENLLWTNSEKISSDIHSLLLNLLKCSPQVKSRTLSWLGGCLKANADRGKLWNAQVPDFSPGNFATVSDGFMINLGSVLMRLCQPFCSNSNAKKILKVDPTYCAVPNEDCEKKEIHLLDLSKETCLVPTSSESGEDSSTSTRPVANSYSFVTECFFMGHRALDLGYRVTVDKLIRLNQDMARIERAYNEAISQASGMSDVVESIKQRMETELTKYLSLKSRLSEPSLLERMCDFLSASAFWLSQIAINLEEKESSESYAPLKELPVSFPLPNKIPQTLKCIPEFIIENIICYLIFLRRFNPKMFEERGFENLSPFLTFILIYMGSAERMRNPHLRAHLAEALESLLPYHKDEPPRLNPLGGRQRERLFVEHEHRDQIVTSLLDVFVGIEMTGQSVQFEQKFNYRRPMYVVMDYLWEIDEHRKNFVLLADEAYRNMEAVQPPLFLRFVNLLINDAIFLLDESLANMAKLREMQMARDNGEWNRLPANERAQNMGYLQHIGMLARFDNILGRDTIRTLERLTSEIKTIFTHSTMVDRVAAMLNYFLLNLVGPNKKNFKVKDQREYSFDPAATVLDICKIYANLKDSDSFCLAVSQDGRSYKPELFKLAEDVLVRIGGGPLVGELQEVAVRVAEKAVEQQANEEATAEAPEHFLDPIMSTIMLDPVILPSSRQTVDRSTIARHLLSDQTDPFNRAPLTMDQVIPNTELKDEIRRWLEERSQSSFSNRAD